MHTVIVRNGPAAHMHCGQTPVQTVMIDGNYEQILAEHIDLLCPPRHSCSPQLGM